MKLLLLTIVALSSTSLGFSLEIADLEGIWYRTYGIYRPWTDDNQGTISYYEEDISFNKDGISFIFDGTTKNPQGKSKFQLSKKDNCDFITFYKPSQDPNNEDIQKKQGFYIKIVTEKDGTEKLFMATEKEHLRSKKNGKINGIIYQQTPRENDSLKFIIPNVENTGY